jgi:UDP-2,3-diacylglucosamine hydrolase
LAPILFISDLHLCRSRPRTAACFLAFLQAEAAAAAALYILGDLFEYWIGDDDAGDEFNARICAGLRQRADNGTAVFFMRGNRDFLVGETFAASTGVRLLPDLVHAEIAGSATLLLHGDTLCSDDQAYQEFRVMVRAEAWQRSFLAQPLAARRAQVEELRRRSESEKRNKPMALMDVNQVEVDRVLRAHGHPSRLIHGHTHRPACHRITVDGRPCERWVLAAWDEQPSYLAIDERGCSTGVPACAP